MHQGRLDEAQALLEQAVAHRAADVPAAIIRGSPSIMVNLRARADRARPEPDKAEPRSATCSRCGSVSIRRGTGGSRRSKSLLGASLTKQGRYAEAEALLLEAAKAC